MRLGGKIALVTGASGGIGAAITEAFAREGADCVVGYFSDAAGSERTVETVEQWGRRARAVQVDVRVEDQVKNMFDEVESSFGPLDIVVANAGLGRSKPLLETSVADFEELIRTNLIGTYLTVRYGAVEMAKRGHGKIVTISSVHGLGGAHHASLYAATKAGIINFTRGAAFDLSEADIQVNCIAPGAVPVPKDPPPAEGSELHDAWMRDTPLGKFGSPADVAAAALFLASHDSDWVTGQVMSVDGGITAGPLIPSSKHYRG